MPLLPGSQRAEVIKQASKQASKQVEVETRCLIIRMPEVHVNVIHDLSMELINDEWGVDAVSGTTEVC